MADYDPQARRSRPTTSEQSPVYELLGVPDPSKVATDPATGSEVMSGAHQLEDDGSGVEEDQVRPFDTPLVEVADERADLAHRFGVLAAVVGVVAVLALWRRRSRAD